MDSLQAPTGNANEQCDRRAQRQQALRPPRVTAHEESRLGMQPAACRALAAATYKNKKSGRGMRVC
eukprot:364305-Chlamydomonas_euryale.AAC.11